jgi:hypothetical protein
MAFGVVVTCKFWIDFAKFNNVGIPGGICALIAA